MPLSSSLKVGFRGTHSSVLDLGTAALPYELAAAITLADGTGADQADLLFSDTRTLAASGTENLDLSGVLTSAFGATLAMAKVKAILIVAASGNTNDVQVTRPGSNGVPCFLAAGDGVAVGPGDFFAITRRGASGFPVTAGTGDLLTITNSAGGTSVTYSVVVLGTSA